MKDTQGSAGPAGTISPARLPGDMPDFTPVRLRGRSDGWTPERQRLYVAALARWGSGRRAAAEVGMTEQSAARLRRRAEAASFARACEAACRAGKIRRRAGAGPPTFSPLGTFTFRHV